MSQILDNNLINVAIRIRPFLPKDNHIEALKVIDSEPPSIVVEDKELQFFCDHVFNENVNQETIFNEMVSPNIEQLFDGQSCTIFAYGQTGTGKTYTMGTDPNSCFGKNSGIVPKTLEKIFAHKIDDDKEAQIYISFIEIYNEKAYDLLTNDRAYLQMKAFTLQNLNIVHVKDAFEASKWLTIGSQNRHIGETKLNTKSSRSHAIFTLYCKIRDENSEFNSKLHLVDLAGSESVKRTGNEGVQFQESVNINKGLFYVGQVIKALCSNTVPPYRASTLTKILHDSLTRVNHVSLIACVSPSVDDITETIATLDFAKKIKQIKNGFKASQFDSQTKITNSGTIKRTYSYSSNVNSTTKARKLLSYNTPQRKILNSIPNHSSHILSRVPEQHSSQSLYSMNLSSISTITDCALNLSPIVKRCAEKLEATMMNKLETIVKAQLQGMRDMDQQGTPLQWKKIESKVFDWVQSGMKQTKKSVEPLPNACSSPKYEDISQENSAGDFENHLPQPQQLDFSDITNITPEASYMAIDIENVSIKAASPSFQFKAPFDLPKRATRIKKLNKNESLMVAPPRRSVRLSLKPSIKTSPITIARRKSIRLSRKKSLEKSLELLNASRSSKPLSTKQQKALKVHESEVLKVLNVGSLKQLQKLATIGPKTSIQIRNYRNLVGEFKSIADLKKLPGWKGYNRFLAGNFLRVNT